MMDQTKGKQQNVYRNYKFSNHQYNHHNFENNFNPPSSHGYFKSSRIPKHSLKWRKDHYVGNCRSKYPYRKNDLSCKKSGKSSEDAEEEERKKKLNATAKILLNKIKSWSAEKNVSEEPTNSKGESHHGGDANQETSECDSWHSEDKVGGENKKRIAHSRKAKLIKSWTPKRLRQPVKPTAKYDVNKATVKDFQSRIQHKLIEEIMQMPKENLQNVLNDPKINPIMGLKMSRLVQENRPLITQKLRALAESKMKTLGFTSNPQLLVDIDKLIDPVIETDLSVLPYELIKQMENVFQVQFDYCPSNVDQYQVSGADIVCGDSDCNKDRECVEVSSLDTNESTALNEDLSMYECSTDEDEETNTKELSVDLEEDNCTSVVTSNLPHCTQETEFSKKAEVILEQANELKQHFVDLQQPLCDAESNASQSKETKEKISSVKEDQSADEQRCHPPLGMQIQNVSAEPTGIVSPSCFSSITCQTDSLSHQDISTQTSHSHMDVLYGVPLPKESKDNNTSSLLEEANSIQILTNRLNERRLMIFLELSKMDPEGSFVSNGRTKRNFAETLSNGSISLMEGLENFIKVRLQKKCKSKNKNKLVKSKFKNNEVR